MEALHTPLWVFVSSFSTSLLFIWLGRRRVERIMREVRELEKRNRRLERFSSLAVQKIRDKNRELRCEKEYFDKFSAENGKYIVLGRILFLASEKYYSRKMIAFAIGYSESKLNYLCTKYNIKTFGVIRRENAFCRRSLEYFQNAEKDRSGKMTNEHE
ncbi:hypothetical protein [uncultured Desulfovibrio sp.]|uniref:hypothetical protein n=1 Tax=uncultured Desulfovibrio sp. TaxID=167968 RepID=UPI0025FC98DF|nr:hypothetical protein [uncultured Desulfovibrio sp.]